jgi:hypothetical protein
VFRLIRAAEWPPQPPDTYATRAEAEAALKRAEIAQPSAVFVIQEDPPGSGGSA